jgi:3-methylfumaryl-CoA hydratase
MVACGVCRRKLPPGWSLVLFPPTDSTTASLGPDGTERGPIHPPAPLERMWVAGSFEFPSGQALSIGEKVTCETVVEGVNEKTGSDGRKGWYVHQRREIKREGEDTKVVVERRTHLYRYPVEEGMEKKVEKKEKKKEEEGPKHVDFALEFLPTPNTLFRYSALTFNTHRIHWDLSYAVGIEGRPGKSPSSLSELELTNGIDPGLIVHGPLTSLLLLNTLRQAIESLHPTATVNSFTYRATAPLVAGTKVRFAGRWKTSAPWGKKECEVWVEDEQGIKYMTGSGVMTL